MTGPREIRRRMLTRAKVEARARIEWTLAGPIAETWDPIAGQSAFYWVDGIDEEALERDAEELEGASLSNGGVPGDMAQALRFAEELCRSRRMVGRLMDEITEGVEAKLRDDARYWRTIKVLADALVGHRRYRLSGDQAVKVMRKAWYIEQQFLDPSLDPNALKRGETA